MGQVQYDYLIGFLTTTCAACGIAFGLPLHYEQKRREDGAAFYCPNGHSLIFAEGENAKLKRRLAFEETRRQAAERELRQAEADRRTAEITHKRNLTRLKNRVAKGVCLFCHRFFKDVHNHMQTQHAEEYGAATPKVLAAGETPA